MSISFDPCGVNLMNKENFIFQNSSLYFHLLCVALCVISNNIHIANIYRIYRILSLLKSYCSSQRLSFLRHRVLFLVSNPVGPILLVLDYICSSLFYHILDNCNHTTVVMNYIQYTLYTLHSLLSIQLST